MKLEIFSVYDLKAGAFATPFFQLNQAMAMRAFAAAAADPETLLAKHPGDFALNHLGTFDDSSGFIDPLPKPHHLGTAAQFLNSKEQDS